MSLKWTRHPIVDVLIPPVGEEELKDWLARPGGYEAALEYWERHERAIRDAAADPLTRGFELEFWKDFREFLSRKDELYALGGNGPGKTEIGGKLVVETLMRDRNQKVLCVALNEYSSKQLQQPGVHKYLPASLRSMSEALAGKRRSPVANLNWSQKGGFTEGTFVLPNRSQCWFKTVEQYERDATSFEGPEYDLVWIDEPAPVALVDTLTYRVAKRRGKFLFTFTAIHGFDAVCNRVLTGAKVLKSLPINWQWRLDRAKGTPGGKGATDEERGGPDARIVVPELRLTDELVKGCPPGHMPYMMQPLNPSQGVIFLWTQWNVFLPRFREFPDDPKSENPHWPELFKVVRGKSPGTVRTRLFGWAEKISGCQFPQFSPNLHVVPESKVPEEGTDYMSADPATARSYFLLWARIDRQGRVFVFDESPRVSEGEWVDSAESKGEGQRVFAGRGSDFYKQHIRRREEEHGREPVMRKGDPRGFAAQAASAKGGENLFELFTQEGNSAETAPMLFVPAQVRASILLDLERINDLLSYDESKAITIENEPRLYISERCQNLIRSMLNWSPDQGGESPWKDPVDALRYLFDRPLYFLDPDVPEVVGGSGW